MKKLLLSLSFLLASVFVYSQITFERHYGGAADDGGSSVLQTDDGGYIITAQTFSFGLGTSDIYIIKTDAYGNEIWSKVYGGDGWDAPFQIKKTIDNNYIIVGQTSSFGAGSSDAFLLKIDNNGDSLWFKTYGGTDEDGAYGVDICNDNGFIITGYTYSFAIGYQAAAYLIRTDPIGNELWSKTYYKKTFNQIFDVLKTNDNNFLLAGITETTPADAEGYLIKTNNNGDTLWMKTFGGNSYDSFSSICQDNNGNFILCGTTYSFGAGDYDMYLIKIDSNGQEIWSKTFGGINSDNASSVIYNNNENTFMIVGSTQSYGYGGKDVFLVKVNQYGDTLWTKTYGGTADDVGGDLYKTNDNGIIMTGYTKSFGNISDVYLIKTDANGQVAGIDDYPSMNNGITVYPNPFSTTTQITLSQTYHTISLSVYDMQGKLVAQNQYTDCDKIQLNRNTLTNGMYFLKLILDDKEITTGKIVVSD